MIDCSCVQSCVGCENEFIYVLCNSIEILLGMVFVLFVWWFVLMYKKRRGGA